GFAGQVGRGHALGDPPVEKFEYAGALVRQDTGIQKWSERVQRQVQRMQYQVDGFVPRVVAAMPQRCARFAQARHAIADQVAQRAQVLSVGRGHTGLGSAGQQQVFQRAAVDVRQRLQRSQLDALVDLVDGRVAGAELDHLRAYL